MILLTGATGTVGSAVLRRLIANGRPVRCLVRDPRKLGESRVKVQIALGDLAEPTSFKHALRGVDQVVHLAASIRDQPRASIEELNGVATLRLLQAAEATGVKHFVYFSAMGASPHAEARFFRSKALAEEAVVASPIPTTVFAPSIVYTPGDPWLRIVERLSRLPFMLVPGRGRAEFQPIWAEDVADCVIAALDQRPTRSRLELAGPETLSHDTIIRLALRAFGRRRRLLHVPQLLVTRILDAFGWAARDAVFATPDEARLLDISMTTPKGTADTESLGVQPRSIGAVLGVG